MKNRSFWPIGVVIGLLIAIPAIVSAQQSELTLDDLFASPKLTGTTPSRPVWAPNSEHFAFSWSAPEILDAASGYPQTTVRKYASFPIKPLGQ